MPRSEVSLDEAPVIPVVVDEGHGDWAWVETPLADLRVVRTREQLEALLPAARAIFQWDFRTTLVRDAWRSARHVSWIHAGSVGVDTLLSDEIVAGDVVVTNTRGVFERPMAEYVIGLLLLFAKDLRTTLELQERREWRHRETHMLAGRRLLLVGAGVVGREIARLARAMGMGVAAVGRSPREHDPDFGTVHGIGALDDLLGSAGAIVLAVPLTNDTRGLLDRRRLEMLPAGAWLVNVGRGAIVDEAALIDALRTGRLAAAGLDVFEAEPLPPDNPLWSLAQVVVSPHMSADRIGWEEAVVEVFLDNLRRWRTGAPLLNVVDKRRDALSRSGEDAT